MGDIDDWFNGEREVTAKVTSHCGNLVAGKKYRVHGLERLNGKWRVSVWIETDKGERMSFTSDFFEPDQMFETYQVLHRIRVQS